MDYISPQILKGLKIKREMLGQTNFAQPEKKKKITRQAKIVCYAQRADEIPF